MKRWFFAVALVAVAGASRADDTAPVARPEHGETMFVGIDTLSLPMLERQALTRNPSLAAMRAAARAARADARITGSLDDPMATLSVAPGSFGSDTRTGYRVGVSQKLPIFGTRGLDRRSARADAAAAMLDVETARLDLLEAVRAAFFDLYRIARALETNAEQQQLVGQFRRAALARYSSGMEGQQDPLAADAELGMLVHMEASLFRERRHAAVRLNALLNRDPALRVPAAPRSIELPALADTARASLASRQPWPELRASDARVEAGESRVSLASRRRLPELEIGVERDFYMMEPEFRTQAMVGFNLPLGFGRLGADEDRARAELARAQAERVATAIEVERRIEESRADYEEALHEMEVVEQILIPTSDRALAAAKAGYEAGRGPFVALIDAARRRADAHLELEEARTRAAMGWAALQRAVAGDAVSMRDADEPAPSDATGKETSR